MRPPQAIFAPPLRSPRSHGAVDRVPQLAQAANGAVQGEAAVQGIGRRWRDRGAPQVLQDGLIFGHTAAFGMEAIFFFSIRVALPQSASSISSAL